ncbi:hypothetical protein [Gloeothece verrucosa]|uniref:Ribbon-helix-helix protein CopG domain-containing protein n=1 Tax=Gloeothece verrucosa (strain PCC 7822) TaxID=497965 RepID=E0UGF1_GLOV7|nr:hypothetical protein [Gloeothece verrucosa]ADN16770.1 conserved hypothetical protein [Gloeothece verrucosa PCC 7822]
MTKYVAKAELSSKLFEDVKKIATKLNMSESEVIRRGIAVMDLYAELKANKEKLLIEKDGTTRELSLTD